MLPEPGNDKIGRYHSHVIPQNSSPEHIISAECWCEPWRSTYPDGEVRFQHHDSQPFRPAMWGIFHEQL